MDREDLTSNSTTTEGMTDEDQIDGVLSPTSSLTDHKTLFKEGRTRSGLILTDEEYERWLLRDRRKDGEDHLCPGPAYNTRGVIVSEREAEQWREAHLAAYDTNLWSLESQGRHAGAGDGEEPEESPIDFRSEKPSKEQLILEKEKLERLIRLKEYQLTQQRGTCSQNRRELLAEKQNLSKLKFEREMQLKERAHEEWRRMNVKQRKTRKESSEVRRDDFNEVLVRVEDEFEKKFAYENEEAGGGVEGTSDSDEEAEYYSADEDEIIYILVREKAP